MKKYLVSIFILLFVVILWAADDIHIPRDVDNGIPAENLDFVGVNYKLVSQTTTNTAVATVPSIAYGIGFSTGAKTNDYVVLYDSNTTSTAGLFLEVMVDTNTVTSGSVRIISFPKPIQTTKGIYATNSAVTFKSTILYRAMR